MRDRPGHSGPAPEPPVEARQRVAGLAERVHGLTAALLGPGADAEDACQEALLSAMASIAGFDPSRGRLEAWVFAIARRRCADNLARRSPTAPLLREPEAAPCAGEGDAMRRLDEALTLLPDAQRSAFALVAMQDLSVAEAAAIEGVAPGTIKSRVARAREQLRRSLESSHDPR